MQHAILKVDKYRQEHYGCDYINLDSITQENSNHYGPVIKNTVKLTNYAKQFQNVSHSVIDGD